MYSFQPCETDGGYEILDPDGDVLAVVMIESDAETLVSHLNRGQ